MDTLLDHLAATAKDPLGTLVILGAGDGSPLDLERLLRLSPRRLILVEGDADSARALAQWAAPLPGAELRRIVVSPDGGSATWHRYSLSALDGLADASPLRRYYPRLRELGTESVATQALREVLDGVAQPGLANALLFNLPGQEDALLDSLPDDMLAGFEILAQRQCREPLGPPAAAEQTSQRLQALAYVEQFRDDHTEPLWPLRVLRVDVRQRRSLQLEQEAVERSQAVQQAQLRITELESRVGEAIQVARQAERRAAEHMQQVQMLTRTAEQDAGLLAESEVRAREFAERLQALKRQVEESTQRHEQEKASLQARLNDALVRLQAAEEQVAARQERIQQLDALHGRQAARQQWLQEELNRAEGQIEMVKGLLLGDTGL
ncbi:MAG: hypothetical protein ING89_15385 [Rubrivivax sp.]|nr:hypothetical protein [Rubrivivax sp.]